jgi:hypothetical protein
MKSGTNLFFEMILGPWRFLEMKTENQIAESR